MKTGTDQIAINDAREIPLDMVPKVSRQNELECAAHEIGNSTILCGFEPYFRLLYNYCTDHNRSAADTVPHFDL